MESSNNNGNGSHASDASDHDSERTQRIRRLETRLKECEQRTLDEIAETTNVTQRLKEKLGAATDTGRLKIRRTRAAVAAPDPPKKTPAPHKVTSNKNGAKSA